MTFDPADRAFYLAYTDGSLQSIDLYDDVQKTTSINIIRDRTSSHRPVQPSPRTRFNAESQKLGRVLSLSLSWDGTTLFSGHTSGKIATWDIAKGNYLSTLANLPGPVSNLQFLAPVGFPSTLEPTFKIQTIVKPKQDTGLTSGGNGLVPPNYSLNLQFPARLRGPHVSATEGRPTKRSKFEEALTHPSFPTSVLEESLAELGTWGAPSKGGIAPAADFVVLNHDTINASSSSNNIGELTELRKQLASLQRIQKVTFSQLSELREENSFFMGKEKKRAERAKARANRKLGPTNGAKPDQPEEDVEMNDSDDASSESESDDIDATIES